MGKGQAILTLSLQRKSEKREGKTLMVSVRKREKTAIRTASEYAQESRGENEIKSENEFTIRITGQMHTI